MIKCFCILSISRPISLPAVVQQVATRGHTHSGTPVATHSKSGCGRGAVHSSRKPVTPLDSAPEIIEDDIIHVEQDEEPKKIVQKARCGKPFSHAGITCKFK